MKNNFVKHNEKKKILFDYFKLFCQKIWSFFEIKSQKMQKLFALNKVLNK